MSEARKELERIAGSMGSMYADMAAAMAVRILVDCGGEPPNGGGDDE